MPAESSGSRAQVRRDSYKNRSTPWPIIWPSPIRAIHSCWQRRWRPTLVVGGGPLTTPDAKADSRSMDLLHSG